MQTTTIYDIRRAALEQRVKSLVREIDAKQEELNRAHDLIDQLEIEEQVTLERECEVCR